MKKLRLLLIALIMMVFTGCNNNAENNQNSQENSQAANAAEYNIAVATEETKPGFAIVEIKNKREIEGITNSTDYKNAAVIFSSVSAKQYDDYYISSNKSKASKHNKISGTIFVRSIDQYSDPESTDCEIVIGVGDKQNAKYGDVVSETFHATVNGDGCYFEFDYDKSYEYYYAIVRNCDVPIHIYIADGYLSYTESTEYADNDNNKSDETDVGNTIKSGKADKSLDIDELMPEFDADGKADIFNKNDSAVKSFVNIACTNQYILTADEENQLVAGSSSQSTVSYDEAVADIKLYFKALKSTYALYNYYGEDAFINAEQNTIASLTGDTVSVKNLANALRQNLSFIWDGHFKIDNELIQPLCNTYADINYQFAKDDEGYYTITNTDEKMYWDSFSNPDVKFCYYVNDDGDVVYVPAGEFTGKPSSSMTFTNGVEMTNNFTCLYNNKKTDSSLWYKESDNAIYIHDGSFSQKSDNGAQNQQLADLGQIAKDKQYIILDLIGNGGGSADGVVILLDYILNGTTSRTVNNVGSEQYHNVIRKVLNNNLLRKLDGWNDRVDGNKTEYKEKNGSYISYNNKTIILLVDKKTASSGEETVEMMHYINNTIVLGTSTSGAQFSSNPKKFTLPSSGILVQIPTGIYRTTNIEAECEGCKPDIYMNNNSYTNAIKMLSRLGRISQSEADSLSN